MKTYTYNKLPESFFNSFDIESEPIVEEVINSVKRSGDKAVLEYSSIFDGIKPDPIKIPQDEIKRDYELLPDSIKKSYQHAIDALSAFSKKQYKQYGNFTVEVHPGIFASQKIQPIDSIGIYVPSGNYPLVSSFLMCAVPAKVAGVKHISACSPPRFNGSIHPYITAAAYMLGISDLYRIGGIQAVAAMAYGTASVKSVNKIVGPGNRFITLAKKHLFGTVGIDLLAGPSEVCIIADKDSSIEKIVADLMAQAEHDALSKSILISDSEMLIEDVKRLIKKEIFRNTLFNSNQFTFIHVKSMSEACDIANKLAPEHLQIYSENSADFIDTLQNFGSMFIGEDSAEVLGDYIAGINHTLPTNRSACFSSGLSIRDFIRMQTMLRVDKVKAKQSIEHATNFAKIEGLSWHYKAAELRKT